MNAAVQPIKKFVVERAKSIEAQVAGKSKGADIDAPPAGVQRGFGPGTFLGPMLVAAHDKNDDESLSREEMVAGFYVIEARDLNEAIQVASRFPSAPLGTIEVRPCRDLVVDGVAHPSSSRTPQSRQWSGIQSQRR